MDCKEATELMNYALDGELPLEAARALYRHVSDCRACARAYVEIGKIVEEAPRCHVPEPPPDFWDSIWRHVRQSAPGGESHWWHRVKLTPRIAAIAIAILLAAVLVSTRFGGDYIPMNVPIAEASSRHGMVSMQQPSSDHGLTMLTLAEATIADYHASMENNDK